MVFPRLRNADTTLKLRGTEFWSRSDDCEPVDPPNTLTTRLNTLLANGGPGYVLSLCPEARYLLDSPILFASPGQEISTLGYPTGDSRATLVVNGPITDTGGHTTAIDGSCMNCTAIRLRNIQIDGARSSSPITGGANIEMGGQNSDQLIENVRSFNPRSWSCLHIQEGVLNCNNVTVQNNDIGPCGSDSFQQWADGISMSCRNSVVRNNIVSGATDGGIVLFGAPGTQVYNNTIMITNQTLLGGINMVDYDPFSGDYSGVVVHNNTIVGGFSTDTEQPDELKGANNESAIIKIGIAIGPRTWFGDRYGSNVSASGTVRDNFFTGAFSFAIAVTSARNFTVCENHLVGNTSFIGVQGPNCSTTDTVPSPAPFVVGTNLTDFMVMQPDFQTIPDADSLTCVLPPAGGDYWPFGGNPALNSSKPIEPTQASSKHNGNALAFGLGITFGILGVAFLAWIIRACALRKLDHRQATTQRLS